jgi:predicted nucleic-acid-binding Zn-ribbon protein
VSDPSSTSAPQKCAKCGASELRKELLIMYGKLGVMGRGYLFSVYICGHCGYSEQYFDSRKTWV